MSKHLADKENELDLNNTVWNAIDFEQLEEKNHASKICTTNIKHSDPFSLKFIREEKSSSGFSSFENNDNTTSLGFCNEKTFNKRVTDQTSKQSLDNKRMKFESSSCSNVSEYGSLLQDTLSSLEVTKVLESSNPTENKVVMKQGCNQLHKVDANTQHLHTVNTKMDKDIFSQLFNTQITEQIETTIHKVHCESDRSISTESDDDLFKIPLLKSFNEKIKSLNLKRDKQIESRIELFNDEKITSQYRKEVDSLFEHIEHSICVMGTENATLEKTIPDEVLKVIFSEDLKRSQQNAENEESKISDLSHIDWGDQSLLNNESMSISSVIKRALKNNASKTIQKLVSNCSINMSLSEGPPEFHNLGPFYGLPLKVKELIKQYKGIDELYDWQDECLKLPSIENRKNLIYALPTSGGKTLVAEILMFREIMCYQKNALLILPYVAIVQEKVWALSPFGVALDFLVEEYASSKGGYPPRKRRRKHSVYIATIEKALGLINSLIETNRLHEIGLIVVDELHLIGEEGRGSTLEACLTKIMYLNASIHIVGMSATIGNIDEICKFLHADVYTKNFRPVELTEYVKCGTDIAKINWKATSEEDVLDDIKKINFKYTEAVAKIDPDFIGGLVMEVIPKDSCLIFCPTKKNCENVAYLLCKIAKPNLKDYKKIEKEQIIHALKNESGDLCDILKISIQFGIAYHHSGLTSDERRIIEEGFREGIIYVICCTSTLAAGVNLPARRVILRSPYVGREFITLARYKQMAGRAGRAGLGETGESIIMLQPPDLPKLRKLLMSPMNQALSSMHLCDGQGLRHLLLSCISLGIATNRMELQVVASNTLLSVQYEKLGVNIKHLTDRLIKTLFKLGALKESGKVSESNCDISVRMDTSVASLSLDSSILSEDNTPKKPTKKKKTLILSNTTKLVISNLGCAAIKGGLELQRAHLLYEDLYQAQASLVLLDCLHLLYLVTPYETSEQIKPNLQIYYDILTHLGDKEMQTAKILGLNESVARKMLSNLQIKNIPERVINRFYVTLMLYDLWNEVPVFKVAEKFQISRGIVQNLMTVSATFASNVVNFCEQLEEFWAFSHLLKGMCQRLSHCCIKDLAPLMELPAVKQNRAKQLYNAGYKTIQSLAKANANDLVESIEFMSRKVANQLIAASKMLLLEKVENLREDAEDVLDGVENPKQLFNRSIPTF